MSDHEVDGEGEAVPLEGVEVFAINAQQGLTATGVTYEDGWFNLAVTPGHWRVFPFSYDLEVVHHPGSTSEWVSFTGPDQSVEIELSAPRMGGVLDGVFRNHDSEVVGKLRLLAFNQSKGNQESIVQTTYEGSGYYNFYLGVGDWVVIPDAEQAADRQLLFVDLPRVSIPPTGDPFDDNWRSISVDMAEATGPIEVFLHDSEGRPVPQMKMHGMMTNPAGTRFECFGVSDQSGMAVLPAIDGVWEIHLGTDRLREAGMQEFPLFDVVVAGERTRVEKTLVEMTGEPGRILSIVREDRGGLRLEGMGESGERYLVEGGSDLENWMALGQVTALERVFTILDSVNRPASELSARGDAAFYRILPLE